MPGLTGTTTSPEETATSPEARGPSQEQSDRIDEALASAGLDDENSPITDDEGDPGDEADPSPAQETPRDKSGRFAPKDTAVESVPKALRHAAQRDGWSEDEMREYVAEVGADRAARTWERLRVSQVATGQRLAQLGRLAQQQNSGRIDPTNPNNQGDAHQRFNGDGSGATPPLIAGRDDPFGIPDKKAFNEAGLPDEMYGLVVEPMRKMRDRLSQYETAFNALNEERQSASRNEALREVEGFFKELSGTHADLYGRGRFDDIPRSQVTARVEVIELADQMMLGARAARQPMSVRQALEYAHEVVSSQNQQRTRAPNGRGADQRNPRAPLGRPSAGFGANGEQKNPAARAIAKAEEADRAMGGSPFFSGD